MPARFLVRQARHEGPAPFSSAWLEADAPPEPPRRRFHFPTWVPDGRALSAGLVVVVSLVTALFAIPNGQSVPWAVSGGSSTTLVATVPVAPTPAPLVEPTTPLTQDASAPAALADADSSAPAGAAPEFAQAPEFQTGPAVPLVSAPSEGPLLPEYRIVTYYGHPHDPNMGIVGEHAIEELTNMLRAEAANYAAADPTRPVIPAFELIATVAQRDPGLDGTYILDTDKETLTTYIDYAAELGMLVVLDLQIGRGTVGAEIEKVRDLLARPNVHLALDPEFAVAEGEIPGEYIGSIHAEAITYAQEVLADISATHGIPPKILIVHQFREDMIQGKEQLQPVPGVQLVIDADGYGASELKTLVYNLLVRDELIEFGGVKLFYRQDVPVMTPQEILSLVPAPDVIIYQ
jgi:hypothetical protein